MSGHDVDWSSLIDRMRRDAVLHADSDREIAGWLAEEPAASVVDVGCGIGAMSRALAAAFPSADVVASDRSDDMIAAARAWLDATPDEGRVDVRRIDIDELDRETWTADLVWASLVVHHLPDQLLGLRRLRSRLGPGGRLALAEGRVTPSMLPWDIGIGRPGLDARLEVAWGEWFEGHRAGLEGATRLTVGWPLALRDAGFTEVWSRSFLVEYPTPLSADARAVVVERLRGARHRFGDEGLLTTEDADTLDRLIDEDGPDFAGRRDDLYYLWVRTVHVGRS
jgi:SAM-dependent methyltransferase